MKKHAVQACAQDSDMPARKVSFVKTCVRERSWRELHLCPVVPWQCLQARQLALGKADCSMTDTSKPAVPMGKKVCVRA